MLHRLVDVINSTECLVGEAWHPAVLPPGNPAAQHSVLQAFREGIFNLLIAQAGMPYSLDGITCDTIIRSAAALDSTSAQGIAVSWLAQGSAAC